MFTNAAARMHQEFSFHAGEYLYWIAPSAGLEEVRVIEEPAKSPVLRKRYRSARVMDFSKVSDKEFAKLVNATVGRIEFLFPDSDSERALFDCQIYTFRIYKPKLGIGTAVLRHVTKCADRLGLILHLTMGTVSSFKPLPRSVLKRWYGREGFVMLPKSDEMLRPLG